VAASGDRCAGRTLAACVPTLGVCLGAAGPGPRRRRERGSGAAKPNGAGTQWSSPIRPLRTTVLGLPPTFEVFQWHSYAFGLPPHAVALGAQPRLPAELPDWQHRVGCAMASGGDGRIGAAVGSGAPTGARWSPVSVDLAELQRRSRRGSRLRMTRAGGCVHGFWPPPSSPRRSN